MEVTEINRSLLIEYINNSGLYSLRKAFKDGDNIYRFHMLLSTEDIKKLNEYVSKQVRLEQESK